MSILVTGGAGYIGAQTVLELMARGHDVVVLDNLSLGNRGFIDVFASQDLPGKFEEFIEGDLLDKDTLNAAFRSHRVECVVHLASLSVVPESVEKPDWYRRNNVEGAKSLLEAMREADVHRIVFSSSASVYGEPVQIPVDESQICLPTNPYGSTKLAVEEMIREYSWNYGVRGAILRYFNVIGADPKLRVGECRESESHLVPNILNAITRGRAVAVNGTDYPTHDGTCIRDYVDVEDVARANVLAEEYLAKGGATDTFNIGSSRGFSVLEVISKAGVVIGKEISVASSDRRDGDPPRLVADSSKAFSILGWEPKRSLEKSLESAYDWTVKCKQAESWPGRARPNGGSASAG